jgi:hypothetical protein
MLAAVLCLLRRQSQVAEAAVARKVQQQAEVVAVEVEVATSQ